MQNILWSHIYIECKVLDFHLSASCVDQNRWTWGRGQEWNVSTTHPGRTSTTNSFLGCSATSPSSEPEGMRPAGKFACMLIDLFDLCSPRFSAGVTFFGPWQAIDMSGSISVIVFPETGGLLILKSINGTHFSLIQKQTKSFSASLALMAGFKCLSLS